MKACCLTTHTLIHVCVCVCVCVENGTITILLVYLCKGLSLINVFSQCHRNVTRMSR